MTQSEKKPYEGIGGWLIWVAIILLRAPIAAVVTLVTAVFPLLRHDIWRRLTSRDSPSYHPFWAPLIVSELVVNLIFLALSVVLLIWFFRRKRSLPRFFIALYLAHLVWEVCFALVLRQIPAMQQAGTSSLLDSIALAIACGIWIPYFLVSKRVRATFTR